MIRRIGILTGGGDCPGLNAVIRAVVKHAIGDYGWEVVGIRDGYAGLVENRTRPLTMSDVRGLLTRGGTILGSSNRANPFAFPSKRPDGSEEVRDRSDDVLGNVAALGIDALVAVGGDGTMMMSHGLFLKGMKVVGVPKTIDNDLLATDQTFGYQTAVEIATEAIDRLHTTAESHDRVIVCEVMGRNAGWIAMGAGLAGGADIILIPEIPYDIDRVVAAISRRKAIGIPFAIVCVAEGAHPAGGGKAVVQAGDKTQLERLGGAADHLARELGKRIADIDCRVTVLGHVQRGGTPCAFDRLLGTRFGTAAVDLIAEGGFGRVAVLSGQSITSALIAEVSGKEKRIDPNGELAKAARATGVELGG
jgi:ATP-dependent phosphofructokinase / diphosphate-dependent phosphofructokinase